MSNWDVHKEQEHQSNREIMAEVRSYKRRSESLQNKKKRFAKDQTVVNTAQNNIDKINKAMAKILLAVEELDNDKYALSLGYDSNKELFHDTVNMPTSMANKLRRLAKLRRKLSKKWLVADYKVLELCDQLADEDLIDITFRITQEKDKLVCLKTVINTIKCIYVKRLKNFSIKEVTLGKFITNKYVKPTRKLNDLVIGGADIHTKFEYALLEREETTTATSPRKRRKLRKRKDK